SMNSSPSGWITDRAVMSGTPPLYASLSKYSFTSMVVNGLEPFRGANGSRTGQATPRERHTPYPDVRAKTVVVQKWLRRSGAQITTGAKTAFGRSRPARISAPVQYCRQA